MKSKRLNRMWMCLVGITIILVIAAGASFASPVPATSSGYILPAEELTAVGSTKESSGYRLFDAAGQVTPIGTSDSTGYHLSSGLVYSDTPQVQVSSNEVWVSWVRGSDTTGSGTQTNPYKTIGYSMTKIGDNGTIYAYGDVFFEHDIAWTSHNNVTLQSSMDSTPATIDAQGLGRIFNVASNSSMTIEGFTLQDGLATGSNNGGGILLASGSMLWLHDSQIDYCSSEGLGQGGAVYSSDNSAYIFVDHSIFTGDHSDQAGGVTTHGTWLANSCRFINNSCPNSGGVNAFGDWTAVNCIFSGNTSPFGGVTYNGNWSDMNCVYYGNQGGATTGSIASAVTFTGRNSIYWNNSVQAFSTSSSVNLQYCDVQSSDLTAGNGNISSDPKFVSTVVSDPNFMNIGGSSKCIDAGTSVNAPSVDIAGNSRPKGFGVDIGAFEFQGPSIRVLKPNGGENAVINTPYGIVWASQGESVNNVIISLSTNEGQTWDYVLSGPSGPFTGVATYDEWTPTSNMISTQCLISVEGVGVSSGLYNMDTSDDLFQINDFSHYVYISPSGSDDAGDGSTAHPFRTLQKGLNVVSPSGTIYAMQGVFSEAGDYKVNWPDKNNVSLIISPDATSPVTFDAQWAGSIISLEAPVQITIEGITLTRGYTSGYGAALYLPSSVTSNPTVEMDDVTISYCSAEGVLMGNGQGGAIYAPEDPNIVSFPYTYIYASSCYFVNNAAPNMEGGVCGGKTYWNAIDCTFNGNSAFAGGCFGGDQGTSGIFTSCTFEGNSASTNGGAFGSFSNVTLTSCMVQGNSAGGNGGFGVVAMSITNSIIASNHAQNGGVFGGNPVSLTNCYIKNNYAAVNGGVAFDTSLTATNCAFSDNLAKVGGIAYSDNSLPFKSFNDTFFANTAESAAITYGVGASFSPNVMVNSIIFNDPADDGTLFVAGIGVSPTYSDIQPAGFISGIGNISAEPMFVSTFEPYNLRLSKGSPCIDVATSEWAPLIDLDGNVRPIGNGFDMGAYECDLSNGPVIDAVFINNARFLSGDIISPNATVKLQIHSIYPVTTVELYVDNSGVPIVLTQLSGTPYEGYWTCNFTLSPGYQDVTSHMLKFSLADSSSNETTRPMSAVTMAGQVQVIGQTLNFPNPFKPLSSDPARSVTTFQYTLSSDAAITLVIYDITGREVKRINSAPGTNGGKAGLNTVSWDGRTLFGGVASNGMYVYKIVSKNKVLDTAKLVVFE